MLNIAALRQQQIPLAAEPRSPVPFHILMKPIGPACNLACRYCYYPQDETPVNKMDDARLEQFIRRYIAAQPAGAREINFVWQGGEPLLAGLSFYKKALALQARYAPDGVTISNSLQTNGTLINDAWCRLFREHGFIIGLSLEGNEALQDYHRPDKRGRSTWSDRSSPQVAPVWVSATVTTVSCSTSSTFGLRRSAAARPSGRRAAKPCSACS